MAGESLSHIERQADNSIVATFSGGGSLTMVNQHLSEFAIEQISVAEGTFSLVSGTLGTAGNDLLTGLYSASETLSGGDGDDWIRGDIGDSADRTLDGGEGHDTLHGGDGNDTLIAGGGNDSIISGDGDDVIVAGARRRHHRRLPGKRDGYHRRLGPGP